MLKEKLEVLKQNWRPAIGWLYLIVCAFDFIIFPILWGVVHLYIDGNVGNVWVPLTLEGAGLFHLSMGGILGISAWSRGQEKISGIDGRRRFDYHSYYNEFTKKNNTYKRVPAELEDEPL